jgi:arginine decarboxylase
MRGWTIRDSLELYNVPNWGQGFFDVNPQGNVEVRPRGKSRPAIDLLALVEDLQSRGLRAPLLIRFSDILATWRRSSSSAPRPGPGSRPEASRSC